MSEPTNIIPLREDEQVKGYLSFLAENGKTNNDFENVLNFVQELTNMLTESNSNITEMSKQLNEMKEIQNHPIKAALNNSVLALRKNTETIKSWLADLKDSIVNYCKEALDNAASLLKIQDKCKAIGEKAAANKRICENTINKIETFSAQYHTAGRALKNMGRMITGKAPIDTVKENGRITSALAAPYRDERAFWIKVEDAANAVSAAVNRNHTKVQTAKDNKSAEKASLNADNKINQTADMYPKAREDNTNITTSKNSDVKKETSAEVKKSKNARRREARRQRRQKTGKTDIGSAVNSRNVDIYSRISAIKAHENGNKKETDLTPRKAKDAR